MIAQEMSAEQYLRTYLRLLWRRKWLIAMSAVLVPLVAVAITATKTPLYKASSEVLLQARESENLFDPAGGSGGTDVAREAATQMRVISGQAVEALVRERLGAAPSIDVENVAGTNVLKITAVSAEPAQAQVVANAYAKAYIDFRRSFDVEDLASASQTIQKKIAVYLEVQIQGFEQQIANAPLQQRAAVEASVKPERDGLVAQQSGLRQTFESIQLNSSLNRGGAQIVAKAELPRRPFEPRPVRTGLSALVVGLLLGVSVAFVLDLLDDGVRTREDIELLAGDLKVIATIPSVQGWKDTRKAVLTTVENPTGAISEAYRTLRTSVQFMAMDRPLRVLQVTSAQAGEGKSTTLANLAVLMAKGGYRVVIVDCDLRRPRIHEFFNLSNEVGLTSVLPGTVPLTAALQSVASEPNLALLPSGGEPPDPAEVLAGARIIDVLAALQGRADIVLIDSPPVLPVADAAILAARVDATLVVVSQGMNSRKELQRALEMLRQVQAPLLGFVLNRTPLESGGYGQYGGYGYGGYGYKARSNGASSSSSAPAPEAATKSS